jgi:hypothetical protein
MTIRLRGGSFFSDTFNLRVADAVLSEVRYHTGPVVPDFLPFDCLVAPWHSERTIRRYLDAPIGAPRPLMSRTEIQARIAAMPLNAFLEGVHGPHYAVAITTPKASGLGAQPRAKPCSTTSAIRR